MKKTICIAFVMLALLSTHAFSDSSEYPLDVYLYTSLNADSAFFPSESTRLYDEGGGGLNYNGSPFSVHADISLKNDGKYTPSEPYFFGHYFSLNDGGFKLNFYPVSFSAGRIAHTDIIDSPYSVYISSMAIPSLIMDFVYQDSFFLYETRWIRLNERSQLYFVGQGEAGAPWYEVPPDPAVSLDRGVNYKVWALQFGDLRLGFQESVVYLDRSFDAEYFLNPMTQMLVQLVTTTTGKPWTEKNNDNVLMGFFAEYIRPSWNAYSQLLIDDINLDLLAFGFDIDIPSKIAWSLGGSYALPVGTLSFHHAGATKYTFEATYAGTSFSTLRYEYSYYPATEFKRYDDDVKAWVYVPLDYRDNYIGYKYGENNMAFMTEYTAPLPWFDLYTHLEYTVSGSKSPANPWHQYDWYSEGGPGTKLLDDDELEHRLSTAVQLTRQIGSFEAGFAGSFGYVWNRLGLEYAAAGLENEPKIFRPQKGDNVLEFSLSLGVRYTAGVGRAGIDF